jgi:hypothetical protein
LGVGYSLDVSYPLSASPKDGDYTVTASAVTAQPGSEVVQVALVYHRKAGTERVLASSAMTITTSAANTAGTATLTLHGPQVVVDCGDSLIIRTGHPTGSQSLVTFELTLDTP